MGSRTKQDNLVAAVDAVAEFIGAHTPGRVALFRDVEGQTALARSLKNWSKQAKAHRAWHLRKNGPAFFYVENQAFRVEVDLQGLHLLAGNEGVRRGFELIYDGENLTVGDLNNLLPLLGNPSRVEYLVSVIQASPPLRLVWQKAMILGTLQTFATAYSQLCATRQRLTEEVAEAVTIAQEAEATV